MSREGENAARSGALARRSEPDASVPTPIIVRIVTQIAGMWVGTCRYITYYDSDPTNTHNSVTTVLSKRAVAVFRTRVDTTTGDIQI